MQVDRTWTIRLANPAFATVTGLTLERLIGAPFWTVFERVLGSSTEAHYRGAMDDRPAAFDAISWGTQRWHAVALTPTPDGFLMTAQDVEEQTQAKAAERRLLGEQAMLRRVAEAVARNVEPATLFGLVASELGRQTEATVVAIGRPAGDERVEVLGTWVADGAGSVGPGIYRVPPDGEFARTLAGVAVRTSRAAGTLGDTLRARGCRAAHAVPIVVGDRVWGALVSGSTREDAYDERAAQRHQELCELLALAVANADARERLERAADTDSLTGLVSHRAFHEAVAEHTRDRSVPVAVAVLDVDDFRSVNELRGHRGGDRLLRTIADELRARVRPGDIVARIGGDEFAILLPATTAEQAFSVVDRARARAGLQSASPEAAPVTLSAGVCDLDTAGEPDALFDLADGALYWVKAQGGGATCQFDRSTVRELNDRDHALALERSRALVGITALARAVDAKDPATQAHSERVAAIAVALAAELGWDPDRVERLRQAGLVHDVGKIAIPDSILFKPATLAPDELVEVRQHVEIGARMLEDVLDAEQVSWVRQHHERPDGSGYPDGLDGTGIALGAALLAVADVLDVMTAGRPYSHARTVDDAVAECATLDRTQFAGTAVEALLSAWRRGSLDEVLRRSPSPARSSDGRGAVLSAWRGTTTARSPRCRTRRSRAPR